jgi:hypothetical protein
VKHESATISLKYNHCRALKDISEALEQLSSSKDISEALEQLSSSKDISEAHRVF